MSHSYVIYLLISKITKVIPIICWLPLNQSLISSSKCILKVFKEVVLERQPIEAPTKAIGKASFMIRQKIQSSKGELIDGKWEIISHCTPCFRTEGRFEEQESFAPLSAIESFIIIKMETTTSRPSKKKAKEDKLFKKQNVELISQQVSFPRSRKSIRYSLFRKKTINLSPKRICKMFFK